MNIGYLPGVYGAATWTLVEPPVRVNGGGPWAAVGEPGVGGGLDGVAGDPGGLLCAAAGLTGGGLEAAGELPGTCPGLPDGPLGTGVGRGGAGTRFAPATACRTTSYRDVL